MSTAKFDVERFTGENDFGLWRLKMRAVLMQQGVWDYVKSKTDKKEVKELDATKSQEMEYKAYSSIVLSLGDRVLREVQKEEDAAGVWERLEKIYMEKSISNRLHLKQRLFNFKISDSKILADQLEEFRKCIDDLESVDDAMKDEDKALMLLNALPQSYEQFKDSMLLGRDSKVSLEEVYSALKLKGMQKPVTKPIDQAAESLSVKAVSKKPWKQKKSSFDKWKPRVQKDADQKESRSCFWCKKPGHIKRNCHAWRKKQAEGEKEEGTAAITEEVEEARALNVAGTSPMSRLWIMDSGCSFHMSSNYEWFWDMKESDGSVLLGDDHVCEVKGMGNISLRMQDGSLRTLTDVRYIPSIKRNLISLGLLEKKGYRLTLFGGEMLVTKDGQMVMKAVRNNVLYYLQAEAINGSVNAAQQSINWHARLGHVGDAGLKQLAKLGMIEVQESEMLRNVGSCEECILGKSKKLPYGVGKHTSTEPLQYVHSDIWGPAPVNSIGGGRYFLSFVDDYSRKMWIVIMKEKSETFKKFQEWCKEVELEKGKPLRCLRTDNGLEFLSREFDEFCKDRGVKRHRTVPHNPQQNGVAERANRTILERVRCMLLSSGLSKPFWAEAASTAVTLINKCPSSAIDNETPDSRWYGTCGDYSRLRPFGCRAYAHIKQGKLEPRALRCVMIGYQKGVRGYRLWCCEEGNKKVIISRDVVFRESEMPFLSKEVQKIQFEVENQRAIAPDTQSDTRGVTDGGSTDSPDNTKTPERVIAKDRARRNIKLPSRFSDFDMMHYALAVAEQMDFHEPSTYKEAIRSPEKDKWLMAMQEEIDSLYKNHTWILVLRPTDQKTVGCKWIFKKKIEAFNNNQVRFKARLVAKGFTQQEGVDYNEIFSPVVKHSSIRVLLAIVAQRDWELQQLDVKTAFLHGELEEKIYMEQPPGFIQPGDEGKVCLLQRSLYGLKQSSRQWYLRFNEFMQKIGFEKSLYDHCVYIKRRDGVAVAYLLLYVDDMLVSARYREEVEQVKSDLKTEFDMKDLGDATKILGMEIMRDRNQKKIWLTQRDYVKNVTDKFQMNHSRSVSVPLSQQFKLSISQCPKDDIQRREMDKIPYANIVGSIMYTMVCTRPDISHAISVASRYMADPGLEHWHALKWILRYLNGTQDYGILFDGSEKIVGEPLMGFCDSDFATSLDTRKSQSGYVFCLFGAAVSWKSSLQSVVALSTTEAEYISLTEAVKESMWLRGICSDFGVHQDAVTVLCDSNSAICLSKHQTFHERSKHVDVKLHFIRDEIERGSVKIEKVATEHNAADMLTKVLPGSKLMYCMELVNLIKLG